MGSSMSMASRVATGSRTGCISAKSDKCLKARTVSGESRNREILMIAIHSTKRQRGLIWFGAARAIIGIFLAAALACCTATPATAAEDLYRAQTVVTGQGEANRMIGFASCMEDVLIKVSGAERLAGDRRLAAYKAKAKDFVTAFDYHDQFSGKPKRDEQGTRDRPFDLTVDFDKEKIDGVSGFHMVRCLLSLSRWSKASGNSSSRRMERNPIYNATRCSRRLPGAG